MKKVSLVFLLIVCLLFSACGQTPQTAATTPSATPPAVSSSADASPAAGSNFNETGLPIVNEKITLRSMSHIRDIDDLILTGLWFYERLEEKTNIHIEFDEIKQVDWQIKLNLMFASGEYPDIIIGGVDAEEYGVTQKLIVPIDELIDQYMPIYRERLYADDAWLALPQSDGKMYAIGNYAPQNINTGSHYFINHTWLEQLNLEVPTTVDELSDVLYAFKKNIPDSIPYVGSFILNETGLQNVLPFWGIPENDHYFMLGDDDIIRFTARDQGYREAFEWLHKLYADGILDQETITQDANLILSKLNDGIVGFFTHWRLDGVGFDDVKDNYSLMLPVSAEGYSPRMRMTIEVAGARAYITASNEHLPETMRWIDAQFETQTMFESYYGPEDVLWDWVDGKVTQRPADTLPEGESWSKYSPQLSGFFYAPGDYYFSVFNQPSMRVEKAEFCRIYLEAGVLEPNPFNAITSLAKKTSEESDLRNLLYAEINTFMRESYANFLLNGVTDASWDAFQKTLTDLRVDDYIKILQESYDRWK